MWKGTSRHLRLDCNANQQMYRFKKTIKSLIQVSCELIMEEFTELIKDFAAWEVESTNVMLGMWHDTQWLDGSYYIIYIDFLNFLLCIKMRKEFGIHGLIIRWNHALIKFVLLVFFDKSSNFCIFATHPFYSFDNILFTISTSLIWLWFWFWWWTWLWLKPSLIYSFYWYINICGRGK